MQGLDKMFNRTTSRWFWLPVAFIVGVGMAFAMVPLIAHTMAIVAPANVFAWSMEHAALEFALFAWDTLVVYGLGIALPCVAVLLLLFRLSRNNSMAMAACLGVGVVLAIYVLVPLALGQARISPFTFPWWQHGLIASLLLATAAAMAVSCTFDIDRRHDGVVPPHVA